MIVALGRFRHLTRSLNSCSSTMVTCLLLLYKVKVSMLYVGKAMSKAIRTQSGQEVLKKVPLKVV